MRIETLELLSYLSSTSEGPLLIAGVDRVPAFTECLTNKKLILLACREGEHRLRETKNAEIFANAPWFAPDYWKSSISQHIAQLAPTRAVFACSYDDIPTAAFELCRRSGCSEVVFTENGDWRRLRLQGIGETIDEFGKGIVSVLNSSWRCLEKGRAVLQKAFLKFFSRNLHSEGVKEFTPDGGHMFKAFVPQLAAFSDKFSNHKSRLFLFEERTLLIPHQTHQAIRTVGRGRFAHWENDIYFSSTDNKDPNLAQRRYRYVLCTGFLRAFAPLVSFLFQASKAETCSRGDGTAVLQTFAVSERTGGSRPVPRLFARGSRIPLVRRDASFARSLLADFKRNQPRGLEAVSGASAEEINMIVGTLGPGGSERQLSYLTRGLRQQGYKVRVYTGNTSSPELLHYLPAIQSCGAQHEVYTTPHSAFKFEPLMTREGIADLILMESMPKDFASEVWSLYTHLMVNRPKVLHCWLDHTNLIGGIAGWLAGVPRIILSTRNVNPTYFPYIHKEWYQRWYSILANCPRVRLVANSLEGAKSYANWMKVPVDSFKIIHNGIDLSVIGAESVDKAAAIKSEFKIGDGVPVIGGVFRLSPEKQPKKFLAVVAEVRKSVRNLKVLIAGIGPMQDEVVQEIIRLGLQDTVSLLGRRNDVPAIMAASDLIMLTSSEEGFPNVLMEAQALGKPVVCTAAGGIPEVVKHGETGFVCRVGDVGALASAAVKLLTTHALRRAMGETAKEWVRDEFSCSKMVERSIASYDLLPGELEQLKTDEPYVPEEVVPAAPVAERVSDNTAALWTSANPFERKFQEAVEFDLRNAKSQLNFLPGGRFYAKGRTCMEIGPGQDIGIPLIIMGYGAKAYVIDKYLCPWDDAYHPRFYRELRRMAAEHFPDGDFKALDEVIANNEHRAEGLTVLRLGLEEVQEAIPDNELDWSFSNATFEHLFDARAALAQLGRITKADGLGFHQTDFRDHRNFGVPLEYITMPEDEFTKMMHDVDCSCGNRLRYTDFIPWFEEAGFEVKLTPSLHADPEYLDDVLQRAQPEYREMPIEALRVLSGRFYLVKRHARPVKAAA